MGVYFKIKTFGWGLIRSGHLIEPERKSMDWFLNDRDLRHKRVNQKAQVT